jgi:hypothetical protein
LKKVNIFPSPRLLKAGYFLTDKPLADLFIKFFSAIKTVVNEVTMFFACSCLDIARPVLARFFIDALDFGNNARLSDLITPALRAMDSFAHKYLLIQTRKDFV